MIQRLPKSIGCLFCRLKELKKTLQKKDHRDSFSRYYVPKDPQQINFIEKLEGHDNGATISFIIEKSEEATFKFLQDSVNIL